MAISQNGWSVHTGAPAGKLTWITGRTEPDPVNVILDYLCKRFNAEVEKIKPSWSWGWAYRPIRGASSGYSNHASGTAVDLNAPAHPLGRSGTFSTKQRTRIHAILRDLDGAIRWGGDYSGRKDEMHFEVNTGRTQLAALAKKIRAGKLPSTTATPAYKVTLRPVSLSKVRVEFAKAAGLVRGKPKASNDVARLQRSLNALGYKAGTVDGIAGTRTLKAWRKWEKSHRGTGRPRIPDKQSLGAMARTRGFRVAT